MSSSLLGAWTPSTNMPPFINFSLTEDGRIKVTLRSESVEKDFPTGRFPCCGPVVDATFDPADIIVLLEDVLDNLRV